MAENSCRSSRYISQRKSANQSDSICKSLTTPAKQRRPSLLKNTIPSPKLSNASESSQDSVVLPRRPSSLPHLKKKRMNVTFPLNETKSLSMSASRSNLQKSSSSLRMKEQMIVPSFSDNPYNGSSMSNSYRAFAPIMVSSRCSNSTQESVSKSESKMTKPSDYSKNKRGKPRSSADATLEKHSKRRKRSSNTSSSGSVTSCKFHNSSHPSLVTRIFHFKHECQKSVRDVPEMQTGDEGGLLKSIGDRERFRSEVPPQPKFPKFGEFCTKYFYKELIQKLEPHYRIATNAQAVKVAKIISVMVNKISLADSDHQKLVEALKTSLFRKKIIRTHLDFFYFCIKHLPTNFVRKVVPLGYNSVGFDWNTACESIE